MLPCSSARSRFTPLPADRQAVAYLGRGEARVGAVDAELDVRVAVQGDDGVARDGLDIAGEQVDGRLGHLEGVPGPDPLDELVDVLANRQPGGILDLAHDVVE